MATLGGVSWLVVVNAQRLMRQGCGARGGLMVVGLLYRRGLWHGDHAKVRSTLKSVAQFDVGVGLSLASRLAAFVRLVHIVNMVMCAAEATVGGEDGGDAR